MGGLTGFLSSENQSGQNAVQAYLQGRGSSRQQQSVAGSAGPSAGSPMPGLAQLQNGASSPISTVAPTASGIPTRAQTPTGQSSWQGAPPTIQTEKQSAMPVPAQAGGSNQSEAVPSGQASASPGGAQPASGAGPSGQSSSPGGGASSGAATPQQKASAAPQSAVATVGRAAATLPHSVAAADQREATEKNVRENYVVKTFIDNHLTSVKQQERIVKKLKPIGEHIQKEMAELQKQPPSPQRTAMLSYLARSMQSLSQAAQQSIQELQKAQQVNQALLADKKIRKMLGKAFGYDANSANDPQRQFAIQYMNHIQNQEKDQAAQKALSEMQGPMPPPGGFRHRLAEVGQVMGSILAPRAMAAIPGTEEHKFVEQQRAIAAEQAQSDIGLRKSEAEKNLATAASMVPAEEKIREHAQDLAEKDKEFQARMAQANASLEVTKAFRDTMLQLRKAEIDAKNDPNNLQNKFKMEQLKIAAERAKAAVKTAAQTNSGQQELAQMLVNHQLAPSELPGFGSSRAAIIGMAMKIDPKYNAAASDRAYAYAKASATQNTLNYLESLTGPDNNSGNLGILIKMSDAMPRTKFPPLNRPDLWAKLQSGNPDVAAYYSAVAESADQVAKILQGGTTGSATSDAKLKQANDLFNKGFNTEQMKSVASTLRTLLGNRKDALIRDNPFLQQQFGGRAQSGSPSTNASDPAAPVGATDAGYDANGKLVGWMVNGKWVPAGERK
jgi:hypothetical protein